MSEKQTPSEATSVEVASGQVPDQFGLCARCGVNPSMSGDDGDICRFCSMDDDFDSCEFCHGTECDDSCNEDTSRTWTV